MKKHISYIILALSLAFIVLGVYREEVVELFTKAIYICLECVGIG
jgi:hypothetical protein